MDRTILIEPLNMVSKLRIELDVNKDNWMTFLSISDGAHP